MLDHLCKVQHKECRVCFPGRAEICFYAEVQPQIAAFEPDAAALCEIWWLGDLHEAKGARVESTSRSFLARWHGELDVIEAVSVELRMPNATVHSVIGLGFCSARRTPGIQQPATAT